MKVIDNWVIFSAICTALTLILTFLYYLFPDLFPRKGKKSDKEKKIGWYYPMTIFFLSITILLLSLFLFSHSKKGDTSKGTNTTFCKEQDTLLVFAGGGSVRNYLDSIYGINIKTWSNSINIAMASGSAWRVLAEEYHNDQSIRNNDSLKEFKTICLSAGKMSTDFCSECMSDVDDAIIIEVLLGNDNLVTYISDGLLKYWDMKNKESVLSDTLLVQKIQELIRSNQEIKIDGKTKKVSIFTTNKTSGTLEAYKKCFHDIKKYQDSMMLIEFKKKLDTMSLPDSIMNKREKNIRDSIRKRDFINLEAMIDNKRAYILYDNMIPTKVWKQKVGDDGEYILLGSKYYFVKGMGTPKELHNKTNQPIEKPMYLYFLAYHYNYNDTNEFTIHKRIIDFLKYLENNGLDISDLKKWKEMIKKGTITITNIDSNSNTIRVN